MTTASAGQQRDGIRRLEPPGREHDPERKPPTRLSAGSCADAVSMKRPAFKMASRSASPKSAPGATRWSAR